MEPSNPEQEPQESWGNRLETRKTWKEELKDLKQVWLLIAGIVAAGNVPSAIFAFLQGEEGGFEDLWNFYVATFPLTTSIAILVFLLFIGFFNSRSPLESLLKAVVCILVLIFATWIANLIGKTNVTLKDLYTGLGLSLPLQGNLQNDPWTLIKAIAQTYANTRWYLTLPNILLAIFWVYLEKYGFFSFLCSWVVGVAIAWSIHTKILPHVLGKANS